MNFIRKIFGNKKEASLPIQSQKPDIKKLEENRDIDGLVKVLSYKKDSSMIKDAAVALGKLGDESAIQPLINTLKDSNQDVKEIIIIALARIGPPAVEPLIALLRDSNQDVKEMIIKALARIGRPAVEPLIALLNDNDSDLNLRVVIVNVLGNAGDERAVEPLIDLLEGNLRLVAADALSELGDARAVEPLKTMLSMNTDNSQAASMGRLSAAYALIKIGKKLGKTVNPSAVDALITILKDTSFLSDTHHKAARVFAEINFVVPERKQAIAPLIALLVNQGLDFGKAIGETSIYLQALRKIDRAWQNSDEAKSIVPMLAEIIKNETRIKGYEPPPKETSRRNNAIDLVALIDTPVIEPMISALASWSASVRNHAKEVLNIYYPSWPASEAAKQAVPNLIMAIEDGSKYPGVSNEITRAADEASNALSKIREN